MGPTTPHHLDNMCRAADLYNMSMMLKVDQELCLGSSVPGRGSAGGANV